MTSSLARALAAAPLLALLALSGCDSSDCNRIWGSAEKSYDVAFDRVEISRQQKMDGSLDAMIIEYLRGGTAEQQIPVKVIAKAPLAEGQKKDITGAGGGITRAMNDHSAFKDMESGNITFDELGEAGGQAAGEFYVAFDGGRTLNGEFCGTVRLLSL